MNIYLHMLAIDFLISKWNEELLPFCNSLQREVNIKYFPKQHTAMWDIFLLYIFTAEISVILWLYSFLYFFPHSTLVQTSPS